MRDPKMQLLLSLEFWMWQILPRAQEPMWPRIPASLAYPDHVVVAHDSSIIFCQHSNPLKPQFLCALVHVPHWIEGFLLQHANSAMCRLLFLQSLSLCMCQKRGIPACLPLTKCWQSRSSCVGTVLGSDGLHSINAKHILWSWHVLQISRKEKLLHVTQR